MQHTAQLETRPVAGSAYTRFGDDRECLTHVANVETNVPLCGRVKPENLLDAATADTDPETPATCPICARRDPRRHLYGE